MVDRLAARGYRHIALVHPHVQANDRAADRLAGYRRAIQELGLSWRPELERAVDFGFASGAQALASLAESGQPIDAVFFGNDALATGALLECRRRGIRVPQDLGIAGFDDVALASQLDPPLTTVRVPMREIGRRAAHILLQKMEGGKPAARIVDLGFEIVERGSTRRAA
jgi:LacI family transcriptional regulator, gluconate utilization system Gnt-I transcriptional repressor